VAAGTRGADSGGNLAAVGTAATRHAVALSAAGRRRLSKTDWVGPNSVHNIVLQLFKPCSDFKIQSEDHPDVQNY
jgi:hypothetical protein